MDTPLYGFEKVPGDFEAPGGAAWAEFQKTATTRALRIEGPFRVMTSESENEPFYCEDGWLAIDARGYPYAIADDEFIQIYAPVEDGAEVEKVTPAEVFERLAKYVTGHGGGSIAVGMDDQNGEWLASVIFGREAPDSPMAGGAAHGVGTLGEALFQAASECGLTKGSELKPTTEQELLEAKRHIESLLRRDKVSATDIVTDETAARKWLSAR